MKKRTKFLAYALTAAMIVTSAPSGMTLTASAAAGTVSQEKPGIKKAAGNSAASWNGSGVYGSGAAVSADGQSVSQTVEYNGVSIALPGQFQAPSTSNIVLNAVVLREALHITDSAVTFSLASAADSVTYQWYKDGQLLAGATGASYSTESLGGILSNEQDETKWVCKAAIAKVTGSNGMTYDLGSAAASVNNQLECGYIYKYTGPSKTTIDAGKYDLDDYFTGVGDVKDETCTFHYYHGSYYEWVQEEREDAAAPVPTPHMVLRSEYIDLSVDGLSRVAGAYNSLSYEWNAYSVDGDKQMIYSGEKVSSTAGLKRNNVGVERVFECNGKEIKKMVDYYECKIDLLYGDSRLATVTKKIQLKYEPFKITASEGVSREDGTPDPVAVRADGKQTFWVDVDIYDTEVVEGVSYQWYSIKDGKETKLDGESTDTLKVKVTDYDTRYKCVIKAKIKDGYPGVEGSAERIFTTSSDAGYFVKDMSEKTTDCQMGDTVRLSIDARVDSNYKLKYKWLKLSKKVISTGSDRIMAEQVGEGATIAVTPDKVEDFTKLYGSVYDENSEIIASVFASNYLLMVDVLDKDNEVYANYQYSFAIQEDKSIKIDSNSGTQKVIRGDDVELYAKSEPKAGFQVVKSWYKIIGSAACIQEWDGDKGQYEYTYRDPGFVEPEADETFFSYAYVEPYGWTNVKYFLKNIDSSDNGNRCVLKGKKGSEFNDDILGEYYCRINVYRDDVKDVNAEGVYPEYTYSRSFQVKYVSQLNAYAKNSTVKAAPGGAAKLEVVAGNENEKVYPITYAWKKRNVENGQFEAVKGANRAVLELTDIDEGDFTEYRVIVEDVAHGGELGNEEPLTINFTVVKKAVEMVNYTPEYSYYNKAVGDKVTMKADARITNGTKVFYEWYRMENMVDTDSDDYSDFTQKEWEILNQDTNEYSLVLKSEDDYTTYKCIATFNTTDNNGNSISETHTYYYIVEPEYSFRLEALTPSTQVKKVGDSATYSVRLLTDNPAVQESKVAYEWYYMKDGKKEVIEKATEAAYTVSSLKAEDFRTLYCNAIYVLDKEKERVLTHTISFRTTVYTDAYLEKSRETVRVALGDDVTLAPVVNNAQGKEITYQWYRYAVVSSSSGYDWREEIIIHGAESQNFTIKNIGQDELITYHCKIFCDGAEMATYSVNVEEDVDPSRLRIDIAEGYEKNVKAVLGQSASFAVTVQSNKFTDSQLKYQWYHGAKAIGGATEASYKVDKVTINTLGDYKCVVTDPNGRHAEIFFTLSQTTGFQVENNTYYGDVYENVGDYVGYQTTFGGQVTLTAAASISNEYNLFYQWYHYDKERSGWQMIYGAQQPALSVANVSEAELGRYYCRVSSAIGEYENLYYLVYVDTGLVVAPDARNVLVQADGTVKMHVVAAANDGEGITYKWSKKKESAEENTDWNDDYTGPTPIPTDNPDLEEDDGYETISGVTGDTFTLPELREGNYGTYRCIVSTRGEEYAFGFSLQPSYKVDKDRVYAEQGDTVNLKAQIVNPAVDVQYTYTWYAEDTSTGTLHRVDDAVGADYAAVVPKVVQAGWTYGYESVSYRCVIRDAGKTDKDKKGKILKDSQASLNVLPIVSYGSGMPESNHPNDKDWDVQGYKIDGATKLKVTFDDKTDMGDAVLLLIDKAGKSMRYFKTQTDLYNEYYGKTYSTPMDDEAVVVGNTVYVDGDRVIFLMNRNTRADSYGYKVASIEKIAGADIPTAVPASSSAVKKVPAKGKKYTKGNLIYKVTKSHKTKGTVAVVGVKASKKKKVTSISIPATIKLKSYKFKITAVNKNAVKGCAKLKKVIIGNNVTSIGASAFAANKNLAAVTIGKNVKKIGANAFSGDKKLKKITIKSTKLKSVGKKAFAKVPKKAVVKVPKKQKKAYKKLLKKKGGFKGKVK